MPIGAARLGFWFVNQSPPLPPPDTPVEQFPNLGFEQGVTGWTVVTQSINWFGGSILGGFATPSLPNPYIYGSTGPAQQINTMPNFSYALDQTDKPITGQTQSMHLYMGQERYGVINPPGSALFGPAIFSNFYVTFNAGDSCAFDWRAISGEDAYTLYCYMIEKDTGSVISLLRTASPNQNFDSAWATTTTVVPTAGNYKFVFVSGSWDSTFGTVVSGQMLIDNIRRIPL